MQNKLTNKQTTSISQYASRSLKVILVGNGLTWHTDLSHPKNKFLPKKNCYTCPKRQNLSHPSQKINSPPKEKVSYTYQKK